VIPGQRLSTEPFEILPFQSGHGTPATQLHLAISPIQTGRCNGTGPGFIGAIQRLEPGVHPGTCAPGRLDHGCQTSVAAPHEILHGRETDIGEVEAHTTQSPSGVPQQLLASDEFRRRHAVPLKRRVRLRREIADGDVEAQAPQIPATLLQHPAGLGNAEHIGIRLPRKTDHEIELDLAIAVLHRRSDPLQQVVIGQPLVDDVAQALRACFRREGQPRLAGATKNVGNVLIKAIHPLAGQLQRDIAVREPVAQLNANGRQCQVITAAERQQREIAVAGLAHAGLNGLNHRLRLHIAGRARQHSRLTEPAATGAAATNLHRESVMHRLHMRHQTHGVMRHRGRHPPQHPLRQSRFQGFDGDPVGPGRVERGHVDPWHQGEIAKQCRAT